MYFVRFLSPENQEWTIVFKYRCPGTHGNHQFSIKIAEMCHVFEIYACIFYLENVWLKEGCHLFLHKAVLRRANQPYNSHEDRFSMLWPNRTQSPPKSRITMGYPDKLLDGIKSLSGYLITLTIVIRLLERRLCATGPKHRETVFMAGSCKVGLIFSKPLYAKKVAPFL